MELMTKSCIRRVAFLEGIIFLDWKISISRGHLTQKDFVLDFNDNILCIIMRREFSRII